MSYHMDREVDAALIRLLDALCEWERNSGRHSTLILIPHCSDEKTVIAQDGKPIPENSLYHQPNRILEMALRDRES